MEHRWGTRLSTRIPVRLRCLQSPDSGCRCLGCLENVSVSGALIRTELGISPSTHVAIETLTPTPGLPGGELRASVVRGGAGEMAVEWLDLASTGILAALSEARPAPGHYLLDYPAPAPRRVSFCALASSTDA
jgi:hypothetical protein